jgi:transcriptional regulator with XRE-family HTH domain
MQGITMSRSRSKTEDDGPNPVDLHVGGKVKTRRLMLGLSQEELAQAIGLTFQQVQKYEKGTNRISVSRLMDISRALKSPVDYFLSGAAAAMQSKKLAIKGFSDTKQSALEGDPMTRRDVLELVRAYQQIEKPQLKKQLLEMAKAMAKTGNDS